MCSVCVCVCVFGIITRKLFASLETKLQISIFHDEASDLEWRILEKGAGRKEACRNARKRRRKDEAV